jgi:pimeloyl-ACP methyl ester carboxylesterase
MSRPRSRQLAFRDIMRCGFLVPPADALDLALSSIRCEVIDDVIAAIRSDAALPQDLDQVAAPVLLAWAERDRVLPAATCSSRFRREIPDAEFRVLPRVGHLPMWDDSRLIVDTIVEWVTRHTRTEPLPSPAAGRQG